MIVGGRGGDLDPKLWKEWIVAYKGWTDEEWEAFYDKWDRASELNDKNTVLAGEGIGIFTWGGSTWDEAIGNAHSSQTKDMVDDLASQMASMEDVTLIGWSKGGNLVLHYMQQLESGEFETAITPLRAVLLAPGTHPAGPAVGASWVKNEVPTGGPRAINICAHQDPACPLTVRNAHNINPPKEQGHGPHGNYALPVIDALNVVGHHAARTQQPYYPFRRH